MVGEGKAALAVAVEVEDLLYGQDIAACIGAVPFLQVGDGRVQKFLDQGLAHVFEGLAHSLVVCAKAAHGARHLVVNGLLAYVHKLLDDGLDAQALHPGVEVLHLLFHYGLGLDGLAAPGCQVLLDNFLQIVDVVEVDVVQAVHVRIHVPRHCDVDEEHGPVASGLQDCLYVACVDNGLRSTRGGDDYVHLAQGLAELFEGHCPAVVEAGKILGPGIGPVAHEDFGDAVLHKVGCGKFCHFASAYQHGLVVFHGTEDALGKFHCRVADGHCRGGHCRFRAHALCHAEGLVQKVVQDDTCGVACCGLPVGVLELAQDLGLAKDHGVQARGNREEVPHSIVVVVGVDVGLEIPGGGVPGAGPQLKHAGSDVPCAHGEQFHPVAGGEDERLLDGAAQGQCPFLGRGVVHESKAFAHIHLGRAVVQTNKYDFTIHGIPL